MAAQRVHKLHITMLISTGFATALLIPLAVETARTSYYWSRESQSTYAFIPMSFTIISLVAYFGQHLRNKKEGVEGKNYPVPWAINHFMIFGGYMTSLIIMWIRDPPMLHHAPGLAMLEAYATVPLMINMLIHMVLFFYNIYIARGTIFKWLNGSDAAACPHCHHRIGGGDDQPKKNTREGYSLLRGEDYDDDAARASEDRQAVGPIVDV